MNATVHTRIDEEFANEHGAWRDRIASNLRSIDTEVDCARMRGSSDELRSLELLQAAFRSSEAALQGFARSAR